MTEKERLENQYKELEGELDRLLNSESPSKKDAVAILLKLLSTQIEIENEAYYGYLFEGDEE